jgi:hypothetical protein
MTRFILLGMSTSVCLGLSGCGSGASLDAFRIDESMFYQPVGGVYNSQEWVGTVVIGHGVVEPAKIDVTNKANGRLHICGQYFRVYDGSSDLDLFDPYCLHITFVDLDGDGYRDLVLEGERLEQDDDDAPIRRISVLQVFRYDVEAGRFELMPALKEGAPRAPSLLLD